MPVLDSKTFGSLEYEPNQLIRLVAPLPGLPETHWLLPVSQKVIAPFVFFQSLEMPERCLLATPARVVKEDYRLDLAPEDRDLLGIPCESNVPMQDHLGVFAFVSVTQDQLATANLLAPLVIHLAENRALQAIQPLDESFLRFPLDLLVEEPPAC